MEKILELALQIVVPPLLILATWLAHRAIRAIESKAKIDIPIKQEEMVDAWVAAGITLAEEKARNLIKANTGEKLTSHEKLNAAVNFVLDLAQKNGWIGWTRDLVEKKIESALGASR